MILSDGESGMRSPMAIEPIVEGVYELGTRTVNSCVIDGDDGVTLVDTLVSGKGGLIEESLKELGRSRTDVKAILLTHSHMDHTGSTAAVKSASNAALRIRSRCTCDRGCCEGTDAANFLVLQADGCQCSSQVHLPLRSTVSCRKTRMNCFREIFVPSTHLGTLLDTPRTFLTAASQTLWAWSDSP
jgi:hypothetical protein